MIDLTSAPSSSALLTALSLAVETGSSDLVESLLEGAGLIEVARDEEGASERESLTLVTPSVEVALPTPDPYYGLLSAPPGRWHLVSHGREKAVVLQGSDDFLRLNTNMIASFGGGRVTAEHRNVKIEGRHLFAHTMIVPVTEERLIAAIQSYLYGQVYKAKAQVKELLDEEGDVYGLEVLNAPDMMEEARILAAQFYATGMKDDIVGSIAEAGSTPVHEFGLGSNARCCTGTDDE